MLLPPPRCSGSGPGPCGWRRCGVCGGWRPILRCRRATCRRPGIPRLIRLCRRGCNAVGAWSALRYAMSMRRVRRIGLSEADRLVAGARPEPGLEGLAGLLDAARSPTPGEDLAG